MISFSIDSAITATFWSTAGPLRVDLRLDDVEAPLLQQPAEFVDARILLFAAGEVHRRQAVQFGEPIEVESRQRLLEKIDVEPLELLRGVERALEAPRHTARTGKRRR